MIKEDDLQAFRLVSHPPSWAQTDSNRRPSACKADALNQLSYAPFAVTIRFGDAKVLFFLDSANFFPFNPFPAPWEHSGPGRASRLKPQRTAVSSILSQPSRQHLPFRAVPAAPAVPDSEGACRAIRSGPGSPGRIFHSGQSRPCLQCRAAHFLPGESMPVCLSYP